MKFPQVLRSRCPMRRNEEQSSSRSSATSTISKRFSVSSISDDSPDRSSTQREDNTNLQEMNVVDISVLKEDITATISSMHETENGVYDPSLRYDYSARESSVFDDDMCHPARQAGFSDRNCSCCSGVDDKCREKMLDWKFKMVDFFSLDRSIVSISTNYQDRFLSTPLGESAQTTREVFRIASVTCLYIAIKLYVPHKWNVTAHAFAQLCRGTISGENIDSMEMRILFALGWSVNPPIPLAYTELYLDLMFRTIERTSLPPSSSSSSSSLLLLRGSHSVEDDDDSVIGHLVLPCLSDSHIVSQEKDDDTSSSSDQAKLFANVQESILDLAKYQFENVITNLKFLHTRYSVIATASLLNSIEGVMDQYPELCSFLHECLDLVHETALQCNIGSEYELDEARCAILNSIVATAEENSPMKLMHAEMESQQQQHSTDASVSTSSSVMHPTSPTSAAISVNSKLCMHGENESPKSALARVVRMRLHSVNFI